MGGHRTAACTAAPKQREVGDTVGAGCSVVLPRHREPPR